MIIKFFLSASFVAVPIAAATQFYGNFSTYLIDKINNEIKELNNLLNLKNQELQKLTSNEIDIKKIKHEIETNKGNELNSEKKLKNNSIQSLNLEIALNKIKIKDLIKESIQLKNALETNLNIDENEKILITPPGSGQNYLEEEINLKIKKINQFINQTKEKAQNKYKQLEREVQDLKIKTNENEIQQQQKQYEINEITRQETIFTDLINKINSLKVPDDGYKRSINNKKTEINSLKRQLETNQNNRLEIERQIESKNNELKQLESDESEYIKKSVATSKLQSLASQKTTLESQHDEKQKIIDKNKSDIPTKEQKLNGYDINPITTKYQELKNKYDELENKTNEIISSKERIKNIDLEIKNIPTEITQKEIEINAIKEKQNSTKDEIKKINEKIENLKIKLKQETKNQNLLFSNKNH